MEKTKGKQVAGKLLFSSHMKLQLSIELQDLKLRSFPPILTFYVYIGDTKDLFLCRVNTVRLFYRPLCEEVQRRYYKGREIKYWSGT